MKVFALLILVTLVITAEGGMMGGPPTGIGGAVPGSMGPPPFVQALIASKGKQFGGAGGPPGVGGLLGPPPFVQQLIAAKNAAAAQQAAEEAALAQQLAASQNGGHFPNPITGPGNKYPPFHNILSKKGSQAKNDPLSSILIQQFIQAQIAKNSLCQNHTSGILSPINTSPVVRPEPVGFYGFRNTGSLPGAMQRGGNFYNIGNIRNPGFGMPSYGPYHSMNSMHPLLSPVPYPMISPAPFYGPVSFGY